MKTKLLLKLLLLTSITIYAQNVNIPDANLKSILVNNNSINTNGDTEIQVSEANAYNGIINGFNQNISDLTGIETFTNVQRLFLGQNQISNANFSSNLQLLQLSIESNNLTAINVSGNSNLDILNVSNNTLNAIDVSQNINLTELNVSQNQIASIDVSQNVNLIDLDVSQIQISNLDVSTNLALERLTLNFSPLTTIDVTNNTNLLYLSLANQAITTIDLSQNTSLDEFNFSNASSLSGIDFSQNPNLRILRLTGSAVTSLDLSNNSQLEVIFCIVNNSLAQVNAASGNNSNITSARFENNSTLSCVEIDSGFSPPSTWSLFNSPHASYNTNCFLSVDEFDQSSFKLFPNPTSSMINIESKYSIQSLTVYSMTGKQLLNIKNSSAINVNQINSGCYLLKIGFNNTSVTKRFIKL